MDRGLLGARRRTMIARRSARRLLAAIGVGMLLGAGGCKPAKSGGLVVWVESDLALPKDVDRVHVVATEGGRVLLEHDSAVGAGSMLLPAPFRLTSPGKNRPVLIRAVASKAGAPRIERSAVVQIPEDRHARLRLQLNFLCAGFAAPDGSSICGIDQTCEQGSCASAWLGPERLTLDVPDGEGDPAAGGGSSTFPGSCFDVTPCFAAATLAVVDPTSCSFPLPLGAASDRLNVGLKLPLGQDGVCAGRECWVALETGPGGWTIVGDRVAIPPGICAQRPGGAAVGQVSVSTACASLAPGVPPCGDWTSVDQRSDMPIYAGSDDMSVAPRSRVGNACDGLSVQACSDCGTRTRSCSAGVWSEWSECSTSGACSPAAAQSCGAGGTQVCDSSCAWGECSDQLCSGPSSRACGNCGTQRRTCDNGVWSEWSACSGEGVCMPGAMQTCAGGNQACGGNCQWGACGDAACGGAPSEACGQCGTRTRTCNPATRAWSEWSECSGQGACLPDTTQTCGSGGTQACGGNCTWDALCSGQSCVGASTQLCGHCGVQARRCNSTTGAWSDWSACAGEGACSPADMRPCGAGGTQVCGIDCRWAENCTGQVCAGEAARTCGSCGMQTRSCDANSGTWSPWSACSGEGTCAPGATRACGAGGTQSCGPSCEWQTGCGGQMCAGEATRACGSCGTQTRTCNAATGAWSDFGVCSGEGACAPGETRACGTGGTQTCGPTCRWGTSCSGQTCSGASTQRCGNCGMQSRTCDSDTGRWSDWSICSGQGTCAAGDTRACGTGLSGTQTCGLNCEWGTACAGQDCAGATMETCGNCGMRTRTCDSSTGTFSAWSACTGQGECELGATQACGSGGRQGCLTSCSWGSCECNPGLTQCIGGCVDISSDSANCGGCGQPCGFGQTCRAGGCVCSNPALFLCPGGSCVDTSSDNSNCGTCGLPCGAGRVCNGGLCGCPPGLSSCDDFCIDLNNDPNNCGACDSPCGLSRVCSGGQCVCRPGLTDCGGACVDTQSDRNNCGGCGPIPFSCTPDETCVFGVCST